MVDGVRENGAEEIIGS